MDIWTAAMWVGKVGFVLFFVMSGVNHLVNHKGMTAYAQSKHIPLPGVAVVVSGLMMLAGSAMILLFWHPVWGAGLLVFGLGMFLLGKRGMRPDTQNEPGPAASSPDR